MTAEAHNYVLPYDPIEDSRLKAQHDALKSVIGGNLLPIAREVLPMGTFDVLDVASGSGIWAADVARQYPRAQVVGIDIRDPSVDYPSNCSFVKGDILDPLPFDDETFDCIQIRICPTVRNREELNSEIYRVMKPGGVLQLIELHDYITGIDDPPEPLKKLNEICCKLAMPSDFNYSEKTWTLDPINTHDLHSARDEDGLLWVSVVGGYMILPLGQWSSNPDERELGALMAININGLWRGFHDSIMQKQIITEEEYNVIKEELASAIAFPTSDMKLIYNCVCARKRSFS